MNTSCCRPMPEEDRNRSLSYTCFLTDFFRSPQSYTTEQKPGHCLPDVCVEIHPLKWRPEIFGLNPSLVASLTAHSIEEQYDLFISKSVYFKWPWYHA